MEKQELIVGKTYKLRYTGDFCHRFTGKDGSVSFEAGHYIFVGRVFLTLHNEYRNIFFDPMNGYVMFDSNDKLSYIVDDKLSKLMQFVEENEIDKTTIKKLIKEK